MARKENKEEVEQPQYDSGDIPTCKLSISDLLFANLSDLALQTWEHTETDWFG